MLSKKKAFTLIELLIVVLVIGVLSAVALPRYKKAVIKSHYANLKPLVRSMSQALQVYRLANPSADTVTIDQLEVEVPNGTLNKTKNGIFYTRGSCFISTGGIYCTDTKINMRYQFRLVGEKTWAWCVLIGGAKDPNSIQTQICQQETGKTTQDGSNSEAIWYIYP